MRHFATQKLATGLRRLESNLLSSIQFSDEQLCHSFISLWTIIHSLAPRSF
jgi:hypothetical protein